MEADSYTLHFQIYASAMTSAADPTGSEREDKKERKKEFEETQNLKNTV